MYVAEVLADIDSRIASYNVNGFWKQAEKMKWINQAILRVWGFTYQDKDGRIEVADWTFTKKTTDITTVAGQEAYELYTELPSYKPGGMVSIYYVDADALEENKDILLDNVSALDFYSNSFPGFGAYIIEDGYLRVRILNASGIGAAPTASGDSIRCTYQKVPTKMTIQSRGAITAFADAGSGLVTVTSAGHGLAPGGLLAAGTVVVITDTPNYDGAHTLQTAVTDSFTITAPWVENDATGIWYKSTEMEVDDEMAEAVTKIALATCLEKDGKPNEATAAMGDAQSLLIQQHKLQSREITLVSIGKATSTRFTRGPIRQRGQY